MQFNHNNNHHTIERYFSSHDGIPMYTNCLHIYTNSDCCYYYYCFNILEPSMSIHLPLLLLLTCLIMRTAFKCRQLSRNASHQFCAGQFISQVGLSTSVESGD